MAVIIPDMDLPNSCADCPICHCKGKDEPWNYCCFVTMDDINIEEWDKQRYITCPLKSADEMIAEIDNYIIMVNPIGYILRVIHKYCDKEQENGDDD